LTIFHFQKLLVGQAATLQIDIYQRSPREIGKTVISQGKSVSKLFYYFLFLGVLGALCG
jgi:hypothetical protein